MNGVIITEKNFPFVASKLIKFFNGADLVNWHTFDCGMKKRIPTDFVLCGKHRERVKGIYRYRNVRASVGEVGKSRFVRIRLDFSNGFCIYIGDVVKFCGNRIQIRKAFADESYKWLYETYQIFDPNGGFKTVRP